jgi:hypothetical protein
VHSWPCPCKILTHKYHRYCTTVTQIEHARRQKLQCKGRRIYDYSHHMIQILCVHAPHRIITRNLCHWPLLGVFNGSRATAMMTMRMQQCCWEDRTASSWLPCFGVYKVRRDEIASSGQREILDWGHGYLNHCWICAVVFQEPRPPQFEFTLGAHFILNLSYKCTVSHIWVHFALDFVVGHIWMHLLPEVCLILSYCHLWETESYQRHAEFRTIVFKLIGWCVALYPLHVF